MPTEGWILLVPRLIPFEPVYAALDDKFQSNDDWLDERYQVKNWDRHRDVYEGGREREREEKGCKKVDVNARIFFSRRKLTFNNYQSKCALIVSVKVANIK